MIRREPQDLAEEGLADLVIGNSRKQDMVETLQEFPDIESNRAGGREVWGL